MLCVCACACVYVCVCVCVCVCARPTNSGALQNELQPETNGALSSHDAVNPGASHTGVPEAGLHQTKGLIHHLGVSVLQEVKDLVSGSSLRFGAVHSNTNKLSSASTDTQTSTSSTATTVCTLIFERFIFCRFSLFADFVF